MNTPVLVVVETVVASTTPRASPASQRGGCRLDSRGALAGKNASRRFVAGGLKHKHWANATPIRAIFRAAFENAGLPYFNPDSVRSTLARLGEVVCQTPEQFKAWSQNLGHEQVMTTFRSYGHVETRRQGEILRRLASPEQPNPLPIDERAVEEFARLVGDRIAQRGNEGLPR